MVARKKRRPVSQGLDLTSCYYLTQHVDNIWQRKEEKGEILVHAVVPFAQFEGLMAWEFVLHPSASRRPSRTSPPSRTLLSFFYLEVLRALSWHGRVLCFFYSTGLSLVIYMSLNSDFGSSFLGVVVVQKAKPCTKDSIKYAIGIRARFPPKF